ncbi:hypothetical protein E2C01_016261 [Portunus trituberculatus]|uniref:Uncharacterized protein n=1 Tax=Portunus trituberculatus TaxID=210409 RepID=A0A5B7DNM4_PORTR|nr:hypothetical protein [Portunus trituberculatus]
MHGKLMRMIMKAEVKCESVIESLKERHGRWP